MMLNLFFISLSTSFIIVFINQLLFYLNFTNYSFSSFRLIENNIANYLIIFFSVSFILFVISFIFYKTKLRFKNSYLILLISIELFIAINLILRIYDKIFLDIQSIFSLLFMVILSTYQFFYSIIYLNVVK